MRSRVAVRAGGAVLLGLDGVALSLATGRLVEVLVRPGSHGFLPVREFAWMFLGATGLVWVIFVSGAVALTRPSWPSYLTAVMFGGAIAAGLAYVVDKDRFPAFTGLLGLLSVGYAFFGAWFAKEAAVTS